MKRLSTLAILATLVLSVSTARAQVPFGDGEQLFYNVSYRARLIPNINLMRVSLRTAVENFGGVTQYHAIGNGRTGSGVSGIFELNDTWHIWLDPVTLLPSRMTGDQHENNYHMRTTYNYDWNSMSVNTVRRRDTWNADRYASVSLDGDSGDAFSLFWRLRALDPSTLVQGEANELRLVLDDTSRPILYTFLGREEIDIKKIGTFKALKFTCTMATSDGSSYEEGMTLTVWVSDDANRIPLLMECPIRVGSVRITLAEGYKTSYPLDSLIE